MKSPIPGRHREWECSARDASAGCRREECPPERPYSEPRSKAAGLSEAMARAMLVFPDELIVFPDAFEFHATVGQVLNAAPIALVFGKLTDEL